jgi:hypothetical protein
MKKRAVVLIDGENFRYSLKSLFPGQFKYLPKKADWPALFTLPLAEDHELIRIYWYVVDSLHFRPFEIPDSDEDFERLLKMEALLEVFYYNRYDNDISPLLNAVGLSIPFTS